MSKSKRKMPRHIVLPNGMWRFIKGKGSSTVKKRARRVKKQRKSGGFRMARRKRVSHRGGGGMGLGGITIKGILVGAGAATLSEKFLPAIIPYQSIAVGAGAGKIAKSGMLSGAIGALARDYLKGGIVTPQGGNY